MFRVLSAPTPQVVHDPPFYDTSADGLVSYGDFTSVFNGPAQFLGPLISAGGLPWTDILAFGGDPTGTRDSTGALQGAVNGGGYVYVPPGTFLIGSSTVTMPANTILAGPGTLKVANGANIQGAAIKLGSGCTVAWLTLDGNKANQVGAAQTGFLWANAATNCRLIGLKVSNTFGIGVQFNTGSDHLIQGCGFDGTGSTQQLNGNSSSIYLSGTARTRILGNRVSTSNGCAVFLGTSSSDIVIADNELLNTYGIGVALANTASNIQVSQNRIINTTAGGCIDLGTTTGAVVTGNLCTGAGAFGGIVSAPPAVNCAIVGNTILNSLAQGIGFGGGSSSSERSTINSNVVIGSANDGIQLNSTVNAVVSGNVCMNNSQATAGTWGGIFLAATQNSPTDLVITGNRCGDDQGTKTQGYGIRNTASTFSNVLITCNDLSGNLTGAFGPTTPGSGGGTHGGNQGYDVPGSFSSY